MNKPKCERCGVRDAEFYYHNKISRQKGNYCRECIESFRWDMSVEDWMDCGFIEEVKDV